MSERLNELIETIVNLSTAEKYALIEDSYRQIRGDFRNFDDSGDTPALAALAAVNGEVTYSERMAVRRVLAMEGIAMDDEQLKRFFITSMAHERFSKLAAFSKTLDDDKRAALFTFTAAICSCDNRIDEREYDYLRRLVDDCT